MKVSITLFLVLAMSAQWVGAQLPPTSDPKPQTQAPQPNGGAPVPATAPQTGALASGSAAQTPAAAPAQQEPAAPAKAAAPPLDAQHRYAVAVSIYRAAARLKDLLGVVQPDNWKMDEAARKSFDEARQKAQSAIDAVLDLNDNLAHHPEDVALSLKTRALVQTALLLLGEVADAATQYDHTGWEKQVRSSIEALKASAQPLDSDMTTAASGQPAAPSAGSAPGGPEPQAEKVEAPKSYAGPPATLTNEPQTQLASPTVAQTPTAAPVQQEPAKAAGPPLDSHGRYEVAVGIYRAATRVKDLLTIVQPDNWKMDEAARKSFDETRQKAQNAIDAVLDSNDSLAHHPEDVALSLKTRALVQTAVLLLGEVADAATQYDHTGAEKQVRSSNEALKASAQPLEADMTTAASVARGPELETEKVEVPKSYAAPPATLTNETGTLQPAEVKLLLYRAYVAAFRFRDLLTVLEPAQWKIDAAVRQSFDGRLAALRQDLKDFDGWRAQFELHPADLFSGYKTYTAMSTALPAMDELADDVSRYQNPAVGIQFQRANEEFMGARKSLDGYLSFLLRNQHQLRSAMENDLASCQNTLNYAMHGKTGPVTNMTNINPVFQGHGGHSRTSANQPEERNKPVSKTSAHRAGSAKTAAPSKARAKAAKTGSKKGTSSAKSGSQEASGKKPGQAGSTGSSSH
jgi:hypothetical protein